MFWKHMKNMQFAFEATPGDAFPNKLRFYSIRTSR